MTSHFVGLKIKETKRKTPFQNNNNKKKKKRKKKKEKRLGQTNTNHPMKVAIRQNGKRK